MAGAFTTDPYMTVTLDGENVDTSAWQCINKQVLRASAPLEQVNVPLPGVDGLLPRKPRYTEQTVDLQFVMTGNVNAAGTPVADAAAGLAANKRAFTDRYFLPGRSSGDGTVECVVTDVDGTEYAGPVQVGPPIFSEGIFECQVVMSVTIPAGELEDTSP